MPSTTSTSAGGSHQRRRVMISDTRTETGTITAAMARCDRCETTAKDAMPTVSRSSHQSMPRPKIVSDAMHKRSTGAKVSGIR